MMRELRKQKKDLQMKAYKLININGTDSSFEEGTIPEITNIKADYFFIQTNTILELSWHPAPRYQFVITLKGKLKFTVTNGDRGQHLMGDTSTRSPRW